MPPKKKSVRKTVRKSVPKKRVLKKYRPQKRRALKKKKTPKKRRYRANSLSKKFSSWLKEKLKAFTQNKIKWYLFFACLGIVGMFLFFQDYRSDSAKFESSVRAAVSNTKDAKVLNRKKISKENWRAKWDEVRLVIQVTGDSSTSSVWNKIKKKLPSNFKLYRESTRKTGSSDSINAQYRVKNIPLGFIKVEKKKRTVSTEFLVEEKETVKPKRLFSLPKLKKKTKPKSKKKVAPPVKLAKKAPRIAIVIDDVGNSSKLFSQLFSLPKPITIAVLPKLPYSTEAVRIGRQSGFEVILHQPVEALHHNDSLGPGGIFVGQSSGEISGIVSNNLNSLHGVTGSNNHMGSRGTQDLKLMKAYTKELKKRGMFYLDSWTTRGAVGKKAASFVGISYLKRDVFLDNVDSKSAIRKQVEELIEVAEAKGTAIGIGHIRANTVAVLQEMIPEMKKKGIRIVKLKDLL